MTEFYDRDGKPIHDLTTWGKKLGDQDYKRVASTMLPDGTWISTVWIGLDHRFNDDGPPLIFESMAFRGSESDLDCERYSTEAEAIAGHARMVEKWSNPQPLIKRGG